MKILVIDDHAIVLDGIAALLGGAIPDVVVLTTRDAREGFEHVRSHPDLDLVLLDLKMPGINGLAAIGELGRLRPALPVIVLSSSEDPSDVRKAIALGAVGYVPKSASRNTLKAAIDMAMNGEMFVPSLLVNESAAPQTLSSPTPGSSPRLTDRQIDVLNMLAQGLATKTIAQRLDLSEKTVKIHITAIFKALGVVNRTQAASVAREFGVI